LKLEPIGKEGFFVFITEEVKVTIISIIITIIDSSREKIPIGGKICVRE
jgi:hypothetical protein